MADVISIFGNELGYPHVVCGTCHGDSFHIETFEDEDGVPKFIYIICTKCENNIPINISPVWGPKSDAGRK